jgi:hypothetical protein
MLSYLYVLKVSAVRGLEPRVSLYSARLPAIEVAILCLTFSS